MRPFIAGFGRKGALDQDWDMTALVSQEYLDTGFMLQEILKNPFTFQ